MADFFFKKSILIVFAFCLLVSCNGERKVFPDSSSLNQNETTSQFALKTDDFYALKENGIQSMQKDKLTDAIMYFTEALMMQSDDEIKRYLEDCFFERGEYFFTINKIENALSDLRKCNPSNEKAMKLHMLINTKYNIHVKRVIEAFQDNFSFGTLPDLFKGEKAFLDGEEQLIEILDTDGKEVLESLSANRFRFYAWENGYNSRVGSGSVYLNAGYSYIQKWTSYDWDSEPIEVRTILTDQFVGYILLIEDYNKNGEYTGFEKPIAFIDSNNDTVISNEELDIAIRILQEKIMRIEENEPMLAKQLDAKIKAASFDIKNEAIVNAYNIIKQIKLESDAILPIIKKKIIDRNFFIIMFTILTILVGLYLFIFLNRLKITSRNLAMKYLCKLRNLKNEESINLKDTSDSFNAGIMSPNDNTPQIISRKLLEIVPDEVCRNNTNGEKETEYANEEYEYKYEAGDDEYDKLNDYVIKAHGISRVMLNTMFIIGLIFGWIIFIPFAYLGKPKLGSNYFVPIMLINLFGLFWFPGLAVVGLIIYICAWGVANEILTDYQIIARQRIAKINQQSEVEINVELEKGIILHKVLQKRQQSVQVLIDAIQLPGGDSYLLNLAGVILSANKKYKDSVRYFNRALILAKDERVIKQIRSNICFVEKKINKLERN